MGGNMRGGRLAAISTKARYGDDFHRKIGAMGGQNGRTGGFFGNREAAARAGKLGGLISRRSNVKLSAVERERIRKRYDATYAHLLKVHDDAQKPDSH